MQPVSVNLAPSCKSPFLLGPLLGSHQPVTLQLGSSSSDPSFFLQLLIYRGPPHALHLQFIHLSNITEYLIVPVDNPLPLGAHFLAGKTCK